MKNPLAIIGVATALSELGFASSYEDLSCLPPPCYQTNSCIDYECYVPLYQTVAGCDTFVSINALYWFARERNFYYSIQGTELPIGELVNYPVTRTNSSLFTLLNQKGKSLGTSWSPGVRVEIGWGADCNDWDLGLNWTYFHNQKTNSCSVPPFGFLQSSLLEFEFFPGPGQPAIFNPWVNHAPLSAYQDPNLEQIGGGPNGVYFQHVKANWRLTLNDIALSIGRTFWMRNGLTFRPYAGVRGAWTRTQFQTKSLLQNNVDLSVFTKNNVNFILIDRFIDHFWGVGVHLGIEPSWYFCSNWSIFGNFDAALIYGTARSKKKEHYRNQASETGVFAGRHMYSSDYDRVAFKSSFSSMQPIFDLALGLRFEQSFCSGRYHSEIDLAWEHHLWLENNSRMQTADSGLQVFQPGAFAISNLFLEGVSPKTELVSSTLNYGGPILRIRFDF